jgi:hypothetical protein
MSVEEDAIRELLIGHLLSQGFYRPRAEEKVSQEGAALLQAGVDEVLATETTLDEEP